MNLRTFIERPILSAVISISIVVVGIIGLFTLPVEQYPDIAPPTIQVSTSYFGASAETLQKSVIAPLEEAINGVENMMYMSSSATNSGSGDISIYFKQGTDPDMAAVNVQNRVSMAQGLLPAEVTKIGVTTRKRQTSMLMVFSIYDEKDQYDIEFLENYANINLIPEVKRVNGVGDATVLGQDYSMRIWLKPDVMAQYKLIPMVFSDCGSSQGDGQDRCNGKEHCGDRHYQSKRDNDRLGEGNRKAGIQCDRLAVPQDCRKSGGTGKRRIW